MKRIGEIFNAGYNQKMNSTQSYDKYNASSSFDGYNYQSHLALLEVIKLSINHPDMEIVFEKLDDVTYYENNEAFRIIQVKNNQSHLLTESSTDFWKTIAIWCQLYNSDRAGIKVVDTTEFHLMTTQKFGKKTCLKKLSTEWKKDCNFEEMYSQLYNIACSTTNIKNQDGFKQFKSLSKEMMMRLLSRITIITECPKSIDVTNSINKELYHSSERKNVSDLVSELESWWFKQVKEQISCLNAQNNKDDISSIKMKAIDAKINSIRNQIKPETLYIDPTVKGVDDNISINNINKPRFWRQLELIKLEENRMLVALESFFRITYYRDLWIEDGKISGSELDNYDILLQKEWSLSFIRNLNKNEIELEKINRGVQLYEKLVEDTLGLTTIVGKTISDQRELTRGTYHILADKLDVGWHQDYENVLKKMEVDIHETVD